MIAKKTKHVQSIINLLGETNEKLIQPNVMDLELQGKTVLLKITSCGGYKNSLYLVTHINNDMASRKSKGKVFYKSFVDKSKNSVLKCIEVMETDFDNDQIYSRVFSTMAVICDNWNEMETLPHIQDFGIDNAVSIDDEDYDNFKSFLVHSLEKIIKKSTLRSLVNEDEKNKALKDLFTFNKKSLETEKETFKEYTDIHDLVATGAWMHEKARVRTNFKIKRPLDAYKKRIREMRGRKYGQDGGTCPQM